jgi:hypothetical protein
MLLTPSECDVLIPLLQEAASKLEIIMNIPVAISQTRSGFLPKYEKKSEFKSLSTSYIHPSRRDPAVGTIPNTTKQLAIADPKTTKAKMQAARLLLAMLDTCKELRSLGTVEKFITYVQELAEEQKQNIRMLDKTSVKLRKKTASDTYLNDPDFIAMRESEAELMHRLFEMQKKRFKTSNGTSSENADLQLTCQLEEGNLLTKIGEH